MLATKVTRVTQRVCPSLASAAIPGTYLIGSTTRGTHQRRRSSSKASVPPDSNSSKSAPTAKVAAAAPVVDESAAAPTTLRGSTKRSSKHRRSSQDGKINRPKRIEPIFEHAALPSVPNVGHLDPKDISFSSFFSLHRPLSLTNPFPPSVSEEAFNSIFESKIEQDPWANGNSAEGRPEDVVYALSQTIESLENAANAAQNEVVHIDVLSDAATNDEPTRHLDSLPRVRIATLEETVSQYQPFKAPPLPQPFLDAPKPERKRAARARQASSATASTKSYTTTIVVTESTHANGETTYAASASPIMRLPDPVNVDEAHAHPATVQIRDRPWTPYRKRIAPSNLARQLQRMSIREPARRNRRKPAVRKPSMLLISVKRQRKLKMKKHKYKKLMKKTRNLRRRLENK